MASAGGQTSEGGLKLLVCDRPNPLGGEAVDGPLLNMSCCASGYGRAPITHVHGMTIGELALYFRAQLATQYHQASVDLEVVQMVGWSRSMGWQDTGLPWVPPSPNVSPMLPCASSGRADVCVQSHPSSGSHRADGRRLPCHLLPRGDDCGAFCRPSTAHMR